MAIVICRVHRHRLCVFAPRILPELMYDHTIHVIKEQTKSVMGETDKKSLNDTERYGRHLKLAAQSIRRVITARLVLCGNTPLR